MRRESACPRPLCRDRGTAVLIGGTEDKEKAAPADAELHDLVAGDDFADVEENCVPDDFCRDQFESTITAEVGDRTTSTTTGDGVDGPEVLSQLIERLVSYVP